MKSIKKSYYAVIPAKVRYDRRLALGARLIYGEVSALCNEKGFCWASNQYFADQYEQSDRTMRRWISDLVKFKYLRVEVKGTNRKLWLMDEITRVPLDEDGNEKSVKGPRIPKARKDAVALRLQAKFGEQCKKFLGHAPIPDTKGYMRVRFALDPKGGNLTESQVMDLFKVWFQGDRPTEQTISLSRALTNLNISAFKIQFNIKPPK